MADNRLEQAYQQGSESDHVMILFSTKTAEALTTIREIANDQAETIIAQGGVNAQEQAQAVKTQAQTRTLINILFFNEDEMAVANLIKRFKTWLKDATNRGFSKFVNIHQATTHPTAQELIESQDLDLAIATGASAITLAQYIRNRETLPGHTAALRTAIIVISARNKDLLEQNPSMDEVVIAGSKRTEIKKALQHTFIAKVLPRVLLRAVGKQKTMETVSSVQDIIRWTYNLSTDLLTLVTDAQDDTEFNRFFNRSSRSSSSSSYSLHISIDGPTPELIRAKEGELTELLSNFGNLSENDFPKIGQLQSFIAKCYEDSLVDLPNVCQQAYPSIKRTNTAQEAVVMATQKAVAVSLPSANYPEQIEIILEGVCEVSESMKLIRLQQEEAMKQFDPLAQNTVPLPPLASEGGGYSLSTQHTTTDSESQSLSGAGSSLILDSSNSSEPTQYGSSLITSQSSVFQIHQEAPITATNTQQTDNNSDNANTNSVGSSLITP